VARAKSTMSDRMSRLAGEATTKKTDGDPVQITKDAGHKKITMYLSLDHILALERIRTKRLQAGADLGAVDKSKLIREAIDTLIEKEGV
jgi:hypothetical protein